MLEALRIDPNDAVIWDFLCMVYHKVGDRARFLQAVSRLEQLDAARARHIRSKVL